MQFIIQFCIFLFNLLLLSLKKVYNTPFKSSRFSYSEVVSLKYRSHGKVCKLLVIKALHVFTFPYAIGSLP